MYFRQTDGRGWIWQLWGLLVQKNFDASVLATRSFVRRTPQLYFGSVLWKKKPLKPSWSFKVWRVELIIQWHSFPSGSSHSFLLPLLLLLYIKSVISTELFTRSLSVFCSAYWLFLFCLHYSHRLFMGPWPTTTDTLSKLSAINVKWNEVYVYIHVCYPAHLNLNYYLLHVI